MLIIGMKILFKSPDTHFIHSLNLKEEILISFSKLSQYKSGLFMLSLKVCIQQGAYIFTVNYK
jgi:hypothetical protein